MGQPVAELGRLHLELALVGAGPLGKYVQDQLSPVQNSQLGQPAQVSGLGGRKLLIEEKQVGPAVEGLQGHLDQLPLAHQEPGVDLSNLLNNLAHRLHPGGQGQGLQLGQGGFEVLPGLPGYGEQEGPVPAVVHLVAALLPGQLLFQGLDHGNAIEIQAGQVGGLKVFHPLPSGPHPGPQMDGPDFSGQPLRIHLQGGDQVQPEQSQIRDIVLVEPPAREMGMDQPQPPQAKLGAPLARQDRQEDAPGVAHHHLGDAAGPVQKDADLAAQFGRKRGQGPGRLGGDDVAGVGPAAQQVAQLFALVPFQSLKIAVDAGRVCSPDQNPLWVLSRLSNLVNRPSKCSWTIPVGPFRCLPMIISATPFLGLSGLLLYTSSR